LTSPDGKTHNQIDNILIASRWNSSILDVQSFRGADCNTDHDLAVAKVRERLAVSKQASQKVRKQYQIEIKNRFVALENFSDYEDIRVNRAWERIVQNIKTSTKGNLDLHELKQRKSWFDEECLCQRKQAKIRWIQDPSQRNVNNLENVRDVASRYFRNKKKAYLKPKIEELETNSKIKNNRYLYRSISDFKKDYQHRTNIVQDEKRDFVALPQYFC
jgi:hypothetical protein